MSSSLSFVAFGTFGSPNGFNQSFFIGNNQEFGESGVSTFDLNTNAIKLFPGSTLYGIRKEKVGSLNVISYAAYSYAKEQSSQRSGTFIGSAIVYTGTIADESWTTENLIEFQTTLFERNTNNDVIQVLHSDRLSIFRPTRFDGIEKNLRALPDLSYNQNTNKVLVVYCNTTKELLPKYFSESLSLLSLYDSIYFTQSSEVAEFVGSKGIFKLVELENFRAEIKNFHLMVENKISSSVRALEVEMELVNREKNEVLRNCQLQIDENIRIHQENNRIIDESKRDLEKIKILFNDFSVFIGQLSNKLKSEGRVSEIEKLFEHNKKLYLESLSTLKKTQYVSKLSKVKKDVNRTINSAERSNQVISDQKRRVNSSYSRHSDDEEENGYDYMKVLGFISLVVLALLFGYYFYSSNFEKNKKIDFNVVEKIRRFIKEKPLGNTPSKTSQTSVLIFTDSELSFTEVALLRPKFKKGMTISDVVALIFRESPVAVGNIYLGKEKEYEEVLFSRNQNCFEVRNDSIFLTDVQLKFIPCKK